MLVLLNSCFNLVIDIQHVGCSCGRLKSLDTRTSACVASQIQLVGRGLSMQRTYLNWKLFIDGPHSILKYSASLPRMERDAACLLR